MSSIPLSDSTLPGSAVSADSAPLKHSARPRCVALVDCDNFYVSCERVFRPKLKDRPVVVLSNNDGCIISRSAEAKALQIKMGAPVHHVENIIRDNRVVVLSSNYVLYGDISHRVALTLRELTPNVEVYSIDEAFLDLSDTLHQNSFNSGKLWTMGRHIRETVLRWTGVPVSVGIAQTRTLAKIAADHAKKTNLKERVVALTSVTRRDEALRRTSVSDVWGVGKRYARWLRANGVTTAALLRDVDDEWIRRRAGIVGLRTVMELRGIACRELTDAAAPRKGITSSRSFGRPVTALSELREAVAVYASRAGEKLRRDGSVTRSVTVFVMTNRFGNGEQYSQSAVITLNVATDSDRDLIACAIRGLDRIYREGYRFHKAGIILTQLSPRGYRQTDLFDSLDHSRDSALNHALDSINSRMGTATVRYAATGTRERWKMKSNRRSPRYTTCWSEIPEVRAIAAKIR